MITYTCKRCGGTWIPRKDQKPTQCPKCHSPYWDKPRMTKNDQQQSSDAATVLPAYEKPILEEVDMANSEVEGFTTPWYDFEPLAPTPIPIPTQADTVEQEQPEESHGIDIYDDNQCLEPPAEEEAPIRELTYVSDEEQVQQPHSRTGKSGASKSSPQSSKPASAPVKRKKVDPLKEAARLAKADRADIDPAS